jgi:copper chaperone NosL
MTISDPRLAGQLLQPGEEPRFFDDVGCLANYLSRSAGHLRGAVAYVTDHRTGEWIRASRAVYVRHPLLDTPMGSHLVAYADAQSREKDDALRDGETAAAANIFGEAGPPDGQP